MKIYPFLNQVEAQSTDIVLNEGFFTETDQYNLWHLVIGLVNSYISTLVREIKSSLNLHGNTIIYFSVLLQGCVKLPAFCKNIV